MRGLLLALLIAAAPAPPKPAIHVKAIPFGAGRKAQMAAYAQRHYGIKSWRLSRPQVIVEHYTASSTFSSAFYTFASNAPDSELHERPGVCAHYVIDTDGTIYQLVSTRIMCRHTVGLNYTAIGIEHVGTSDEQILGNPRQLRASLALTAWLMSRFGIQLRNVIGHSESLTSPHHREHVAAWRCQTHGDWSSGHMKVYRRRLAALAHLYGMRLGPPARLVKPRC